MDRAIRIMTIGRVSPRGGNDRNQPASLHDRDMPINGEAKPDGGVKKTADVANRDMVPGVRFRRNAPSPTGDLAADDRRRCRETLAAIAFDFPPRCGHRDHRRPFNP